MPLPTPHLHDRRFQDLVDEAKGLITRYCPEWTDHNVSDPGIALIELFAWMTDLLLYRVNQVPAKLQVTFLELIGVRLEAPRSAQVPITFYLAAPQPTAITIPRDTEVATVRTETSPAITFSTETDLIIRPPTVLAAATRDLHQGGGWITHDLRRLELLDRPFAIFPAQPAPDDAFYLACEQDHSYHVLALIADCEQARGAGIDPLNPPLQWEVWQGRSVRWAPCEVEFDGTGGFNQSGELILHLPPMSATTITEVLDPPCYWLRCRVTAGDATTGAYKSSPSLRSLRLEARGGTVSARHATTVSDELIGRSEGRPGERHQLLNGNILELDPERETLIVEPPGGVSERWQAVTDFAASRPDDRHFVLDQITGTLTLGPALIQPDGRLYSFGQTPPKGSVLRFSRYQHGGGVIGNVAQAALSVLKTSIPYVARVSNRRPAVGGRDAQSLEDALVRAPEVLRMRTRAVTADDYAYHACQVARVARAHCLAPGQQPGAAGEPRPGQVVVLVLPATDEPEGRILPDQLNLAADLQAEVRSELDKRRPLAITLEVRPVPRIWVSVQAGLRPRDPALAASLKQRAEAALYRYLNPYQGGPDGKGWPFGRELHVAELYSLLNALVGVEFVTEVQIFQTEFDDQAARPAGPRLRVPPGSLICSDKHRVEVG